MRGPVAARRQAAVLGRPIAHSLSPVLHRAAYESLGLDWTYSAIDCDEALLPSVLAERTDWVGFSCTMPLKRAVLDIADEASPLAVAVGAANTLLPLRRGGWRAENTDVAGIVAALHGATPGSSATVLGAGGTAQAAIAALAELGVRSSTVLVRDPARTAALRATADAMGVEVEVGVLAADASALSATLVISTVPGDAADVLAARDWHAGQTVLDVVYTPWPTRLALAATAGGASVRSGATMLLHQAAAQVELMTGEVAPVDAMRAALLASVPGCGV